MSHYLWIAGDARGNPRLMAAYSPNYYMKIGGTWYKRNNIDQDGLQHSLGRLDLVMGPDDTLYISGPASFSQLYEPNLGEQDALPCRGLARHR